MKRLFLFTYDLVALVLALVAMLALRYPGDFAHQYDLHRLPFILIFIIWIIALYIAGLYDEEMQRTNTVFFSAFLRAGAIATACAVAFFYLIPLYGLTPRLNLAIFTMLFVAFDLAGRTVFNGIVSSRFHKRVALVGNGQQVRELAAYLAQHPQLGYRVFYIVDVVQATLVTDAHTPALSDTRKLLTDIQNDVLDLVVISPEAYRNAHIIDLFYRSLGHHASFMNFATFYEHVTGRVPLGAIDQAWFLDNLNAGSVRGYNILKRILDITVGLVLGIISLAFYPFIIMALLFDEGRGIFSIQERIGYRNNIIRVYKFRTMLIADDKGAWGKVENRVTKIGLFLRRTRLDELPQLWNVLVGNLSLIGPRPEFPAAVDSYKKDVPYYDIRHLVKPGLSGWAQIHHQEHPHHALDAKETQNKLQYDLYYIKHRSLMLDLGIILKTVNISVRRAGR